MSTQTAAAAIDMVKDLAEAKKDIIKGLYYQQLMEAIEGKTYGEDYDENGPRMIDDKWNVNDYMDQVTNKIMGKMGNISDMERQMLRNRIQMIQDRI